MALFFSRFYSYCLETAARQFVTSYFAVCNEEYDGFHRWPFPKLNHLGLWDKLDPLNTRTHEIQHPRKRLFRRSPCSPKKEAFAVALHNFNPHLKLFNEIECYVVNDTCYLEIFFSDPFSQKSFTKVSVLHPFPLSPSISRVSYRVTKKAQSLEKSLFFDQKLT